MGAALAPDSPGIWVAAAAGGAAPDLIQIPMFARHRWRRDRGPVRVGPRVLALKHIAHSVVVWAICTALAFLVGGTAMIGFTLAGFGHCFVDVLTHSNPRYAESEAGFAWPFTIRLSHHYGLWDYRIGHGVLRPKPFEAAVDVVTVCVFLASVLAN